MSSQYNRKDHFYLRAKDEGYRSRAAYKLIELNQKYKLLRPGMRVVDLGAFPGGWMQVALSCVGVRGLVAGVDVKPIAPLAVVVNGKDLSPHVIQGDFTEEEIKQQLRATLGGSADVVLSDMSPSLTGLRFGDTVRCAELVRAALLFAREVLVPGGAIILKAFPGHEVDVEIKEFSKDYAQAGRTRLKSTRTSSDELYFIGRGFQQK